MQNKTGVKDDHGGELAQVDWEGKNNFKLGPKKPPHHGPACGCTLPHTWCTVPVMLKS